MAGVKKLVAFCTFVLLIGLEVWGYCSVCHSHFWGNLKPAELGLSTVVAIALILLVASVFQVIYTDPGEIPDYLSSDCKAEGPIEAQPSHGELETCPADSHYKMYRSPSLPAGITKSSNFKQKVPNFSPVKFKASPLGRSCSNYEFKKSKVMGTQSMDVPALQIEGFRECLICGCYKPPRASHCKSCNRCVLRKDHHCSMLASCIGFRNHKFFILSLVYGSVALLCVSTHSVCRLVGNTACFDLMFTFVVVLESIICVLLLAVHGRLLLVNKTSIEKIKGGEGNPFDLRDWRQNVEQVFGPLSLSWLMPVRPGQLECNGVSFPLYKDPQDIIDPLSFSQHHSLL